jgi:hypothetical protein
VGGTDCNPPAAFAWLSVHRLLRRVPGAAFAQSIDGDVSLFLTILIDGNTDRE